MLCKLVLLFYNQETPRTATGFVEPRTGAIMEHLTEHDIGAMICGRLPPGERKRVVRHLLAGCCRMRALPYMELLHSRGLHEPVFPQPRRLDVGYEGAVNRALQELMPLRRRILQEEATLEALLAETGNDPSTLVQSEERLAPVRGTVALVRSLLAASFELRYKDAPNMLRLAFFAVRVADSLDLERYKPALVFDVRARAWADYSNALGINDKLASAERALALAEELRRKGSGDPLLAAHLLYRLSILRGRQRRLDEAMEVLDGLVERYAELGDAHLVGRALVERSIHTYNGGDAQFAVQLLDKAFDFLEEDRDTQLAVTARFCLVLFLADSGQATRASRLLLEAGFRQHFAGADLNLIKLRGVEGKVLFGLGKLDRACQAFEETRRAFEERGMHYDAALVGLELAEVWLRQGKYAPIGPLAREMVKTFTRLGIGMEAVKAAKYLHSVWQQERLQQETVSNVRKFLGRLDWRPGLEFKIA